ncbi:hypothetical protein [Nocardioides sp.]|uniref:hypothetical protein n=1 Tax=Nocardioides sp. TaxID=35761 RepID=UPI00260BB766|nr:hypothetical protein [Nocardioides sp.]
MNHHRMIATLGATVGALTLAFTPALAKAASPSLQVGGGYTAVAFSGTALSPITGTVPGYGTVTCTSLSAAGSIYPATTAPTTWADINSFSVACPSLIPGTTTAISVGSCGNIGLQNAAGTVTAPVTDNPIAGNVDFGTASCPKVHVNYAGFCSFDLYTSTTGTAPTYALDENVRPDGTQLLTIDGDLTIGNRSGLLCTSTYVNGKNITFHVPLAIKTSSGGLINFL